MQIQTTYADIYYGLLRAHAAALDSYGRHLHWIGLQTNSSSTTGKHLVVHQSEPSLPDWLLRSSANTFSLQTVSLDSNFFMSFLLPCTVKPHMCNQTAENQIL